jgi:hypothetical protein
MSSQSSRPYLWFSSDNDEIWQCCHICQYVCYKLVDIRSTFWESRRFSTEWPVLNLRVAYFGQYPNVGRVLRQPETRKRMGAATARRQSRIPSGQTKRPPEGSLCFQFRFIQAATASTKDAFIVVRRRSSAAIVSRRLSRRAASVLARIG